MSRPDRHPDHRCGPITWTGRPHPRGAPAERLAWDWLAPRVASGGTPSLSRNVHGRPLVASAEGRHDASWSHSGELLLVALGEDVDVGIDVEFVRPRVRALEISQRYFTPDESAWLAAQSAPLRDVAFARLWCAKEAVLKAHGRGLAFGLHRLAFAEREGALVLASTVPELGPPEAWTLHEFSPQPGYRAALAWRARSRRTHG